MITALVQYSAARFDIPFVIMHPASDYCALCINRYVWMRNCNLGLIGRLRVTV
jgi:hypothetical protein